MSRISLLIQQLNHAKGLPLPQYLTDGAAGMDLSAAVSESITIPPGERALIPTGICIDIPEGYEGQVRPRSGLALKRGLGMLNSPGTIDSDYRGEIGVILINWDHAPLTIHRGDRIAQLVICPVIKADWIPVETLTETKRGEGGFGHTGTKSQSDNSE
jgi:dUTP pyrophosphatase